MMNAVWRTSPGTCSDHASHSRSKFLKDVVGASLNEPFHGILKVRTFTPTQANG